MNLVWDLTPLRCLIVAAVWPLGYLTHELLHVIPLAASGSEYEVEFNPGEQSLLWNLTLGRTFEFRSEANAAVALVSYLAPIVLALPALPIWSRILQSYATDGYISVYIALFTASWFMVFLPSLSDWVNAVGVIRRLRNA